MQMLLLNPLLRVFGSHGRLGRLISWAIDIEVSSVLNVATLFRSDDYASRLVSTYSKAVGMDFIRIALAEPIQELMALSISDIELSPDKDEVSLRPRMLPAGDQLRANVFLYTPLLDAPQ
jgi:hypothetical protein